jgi:hypothetical protein
MGIARSGVVHMPAELSKVGITRAVIDRALGRSARVRAGVAAKTKEVQEYWESIAPVLGDKPPHRSGDSDGIGEQAGAYKGSIKTKLRLHASGYLVGRVYNTDPKAHWLEYGSAHNPEHGYLQRVKDHFDI